MTIRGKAWKFGDDVDTDLIIPARYLNTTDIAELSKHCLEPVNPEWAGRVAAGDVIVAGKNFGCGSSREHAPLAIKGVGVSAIVAVSFARIFYRNAFNIGLPVIEAPEAAAAIALKLAGLPARQAEAVASRPLPELPQLGENAAA